MLLFNESSFKQLLININTTFNGRYMCMGDNGYPLREYLLTPYTANEILSSEASEIQKEPYNRIFSSVRQAV